MKTRKLDKKLEELKYAIDSISYKNLENERGQLKVTIAMVQGCNTIAIGYALKAPKDKYNRELGHHIALGRALKSFKRYINVNSINR